ncbi:MAG: hypothetical protein A2W30_05130 [Ignavibacteria bacterium RBG_16_36_9]|nr:MAG: hypothetical protein A2W30_05130 [Ignavibacteria bacterium RBG_16_36_9]
MEKVISVIKKSEERNDFQFWQSKSYHERIDAIETLRSQYFQMKENVQQGLQRVYTVVNRRTNSSK